MGLFTTQAPSLVPPNQKSAGSVKMHAADLTANSRSVKDATAQRLFQAAGAAHQKIQEQIDQILQVMRSPIPQPTIRRW
jgi:hypothetical protein